MRGQMMNQPLLISSLLMHAERHHGNREIVSRRVEGDLHRYNYRDLARRSRQLANGLAALGLSQHDRVGTLAWNGYRHMELYYGASGSGLVLHTLNPRLHGDQLVWICEDAQDKVLFFELSFLAIVEQVASRMTSVKNFVVMCDRDHMPETSQISGLICYEDLIDSSSDDYEWPVFDENLASSLCYTSGTTGNPKGVLYSHRSTVLHAYAEIAPDALSLSSHDTVLPVVPMFHVNAWGLPYAACLVGAKLVFPGAGLDGKSLYDLFEAEGVTLSAGVPTVWQGLLNYVDTNELRFSSMKRTVVGGSACPPSMIRAFEDTHRVKVLHAWGMTEMSPVGTVAVIKPGQEKLDRDQQVAIKSTQGRVIYGVDMKIVDSEGNELPWDGITEGELLVRGPWILDRYFNLDDDPLHYDEAGRGWFPTGDVSVIDVDGFMQIVDRSKDVIKSGGEWISSIDIENIAIEHPAVSMAACISAEHPKWDERPVLVVVRKPDAQLDTETMLAFFEDKVAKWWIPDSVIFVDAIPLGATGKIQKNKLREEFGQILLDR